MMMTVFTRVLVVTPFNNWAAPLSIKQARIIQSIKQVSRSQTVQFSSVQDGIYALRKAHMRSTPSLRNFSNVTFETVPVFFWLTMALSRPLREDCPALPLSTPLSSRRSMVCVRDVLGFVPSGSVSSCWSRKLCALCRMANNGLQLEIN